MEFLRFGSSIPGSYWGCCAMCIIQNFKFDPDEKYAVQLVDGDGGNAITNSKGLVFSGPTYRDVFLQRLRIGTFSSRDMPNHGFMAILTASQISSGHGKKWLAILKAEGFEFIRTVDNSVYSGHSLGTPGKPGGSCNENYLFGLFRNIGSAAVKNPFVPPKGWTDLPSVIPEAHEFLGSNTDALIKGQQQHHLDRYNAIGAPKFLSEKELEDAGVPIHYAGKRSESPQEPATTRKAKQDKKKGTVAVTANAPFALKAS